MLARAYKERGGGYRGGQSEGQKSLKRWGDQKWMTRQEYEKKDKSWTKLGEKKSYDSL